ncbi:class I SAM-dependent methyltransferase [Desulfuromonas sp. TF]|uniref:class I SAM-dependent methyltransferase n=1 Tax=Desulfuromonas sp. TF TaxID=1232410 RepID=UPI0009DF38C7|nr:class I SAM-dependent methyltransferase [Desulfuromonas sp. TF]
MELKIKLPENRTYDQVRHHYEVEKNIANRIKKSSRSERKSIYMSMYGELFASVSDHPRLIKRSCKEHIDDSNKTKWKFFKKFIRQDSDVVEFASGDCEFCYFIADKCKNIIGVDISDQRTDDIKSVKNFKLVIYDGYELYLSDSSIDCCFSDQLVEHIHFDDLKTHLGHAYKILRNGGIYAFRTPHKYAGPHDVSKFFSDTSEGFHLKEYNYIEVWNILKDAGFNKIKAFLEVKGNYLETPKLLVFLLEKILGSFPTTLRRRVCGKLFQSVSIACWKD